MDVVLLMRETVSSRERAAAALMHTTSLALPFIGPAIFYLSHRQRSQFVAAHSLSALFEAVILKLLLALAMAFSLGYSAYRLWTLYQADWQGFSLQEFAIRFFLGWVALALLGLITSLLTIRQAVRAYNGHWPKGRLPRKLGR